MNRVLVAEWIKLRSLRSTWYTLAGLFVISLGITLLSSNTAQRAYADDVGAWDPTAYSLTTFDVWPTLGGAAALRTVPDPGFPHPWWNLAGMCLAILGVLAAAFVVLWRRDV